MMRSRKVPEATADRVFRGTNGYRYCSVGEHVYGAWTSAALAKTAMEVEQRHAGTIARLVVRL